MLSQNATSITKWDDYYKVRQNKTAAAFLTTFNGPHSNMKFAMELHVSDKIFCRWNCQESDSVNLKLKFIGNQQTLANSAYISTATLINATDSNSL